LSWHAGNCCCLIKLQSEKGIRNVGEKAILKGIRS
jgi:hypothetical protein